MTEKEQEIIIVGREEDVDDGLRDSVSIAGFWMRFWAYIVDIVIIFSLNSILTRPLVNFFQANNTDILGITPYMALSALVFYGYFVGMTKWKHQTLGKMIFGLKVISVKEPESALSLSTVLFREWIGRYISVTLIFLYLFVAVLPKKQGIHDLFADTTVIHEHVVPAVAYSE